MVQPQKAYHKVENYERELIKEMKGMNESPVILRLFICYLKQTYIVINISYAKKDNSRKF